MVWGKPQGIDDIVERLRRNDPSMKSLYLMKHRRFNEADAEILSKVVSESSTLVELNLSSHDISPAMARILASGLQKNKSIEHISIGNSKFGDEVRSRVLRPLVYFELIINSCEMYCRPWQSYVYV